MNACWHIPVIVVIVQIQMIYFQYSECNSSLKYLLLHRLYIFTCSNKTFKTELIFHFRNCNDIFDCDKVGVVTSWWNKHLNFAAWNTVFYFTYFNLCNTVYSRVDTYSVIWLYITHADSVIWLYITHAVICCPFPRFQFCHMRQMWL
jgi:hypothetical protein